MIHQAWFDSPWNKDIFLYPKLKRYDEVKTPGRRSFMYLARSYLGDLYQIQVFFGHSSLKTLVDILDHEISPV